MKGKKVVRVFTILSVGGDLVAINGRVDDHRAIGYIENRALLNYVMSESEEAK